MPSSRFGHVVSVSGSQAVVMLEHSNGVRVEIGALAKLKTPASWAIGIISGLSAPIADGDTEPKMVLAELTLVGEIQPNPHTSRISFRRGVSRFPTIGDPAHTTDRDDLACVYGQPEVATIDIGAIYQDAAVPARLLVDDLFSKHFIVVGTTGCGKSSALISILQRVLADHDHAHILVLDIHSEYQAAFGSKAELVSPSNLHLPFWLLNFNELCAALTSPDGHHDAEVEILADAIVAAKRRYSDAQAGRLRRYFDTSTITVDTPTPFRLSDVVANIDEQVGRLERMHSALSYRRLKTRIETLATDTRYGFMFGNLSVEDTMADVLGRLFRVPGDGRPITVIDLASVPAEILDVVISLISRLAFDLSVWSEGKLPILLVCEEAHRYAPADSSERFIPTRQALARIAKEGRKYGMSLALVTQRPSDLDPTILSQCSTVIAMRLSTERDQKVIRANTHDSAFELLDYLPLLADREAIVLGQGVAMPMRIRFRNIFDSSTPDPGREGFDRRWQKPNMDRAGLEQAISRWRNVGRSKG